MGFVRGRHCMSCQPHACQKSAVFLQLHLEHCPEAVCSQQCMSHAKHTEWTKQADNCALLVTGCMTGVTLIPIHQCWLQDC